MFWSTVGLHVRKNSGTAYEYTSSEAANVCALIGSRLMTSNELQKLFEDGYSYCRYVNSETIANTLYTIQYFFRLNKRYK